MNTTFYTCEEVEPESPIRQGDMFVFKTPILPEISCTIGVVVTPNCDFAQTKHVGNINVLPILELSAYVRHVYAAKQLGAFAHSELPLEQATSELPDNQGPVGELFRDVGERLCKLERSRGNDPALITISAVLDLARADPTHIAAMYHTADSKELAKLLPRLMVIRGIEEYQSDAKTAVELYSDIKSCKGEDGSFEILRKKAIKELAGSMPKDLYYIDGIPTLADIPRLVVLRFMQNVRFRNLTCSMSAYRDNQHLGLRVARMDTRHLSCLTLQLATLYAEMGATSEYEQNRAATLNGLYLSKDAS